MALNPQIVKFKESYIQKIFTNSQKIIICKHRFNDNMTFLVTTRPTGTTAPTLDEIKIEGRPSFFNSLVDEIECAYSADFYACCDNGDGDAKDWGELIVWDGKYFEISSGSVVNIDYNHYQIHKGNHFFYSRFITLGNAAVGNYILEVKALPLHFVYSIRSDVAGFLFYTYENVTAAEDGTLIDIFNNDRTNTKVSSVILRYNPTNIVTTGAPLLRDGKIGTATNPANRVGGSVDRSDEVILKPNTKYLLRVTNQSTANNDISVGMTWYEV